MNLDGAMKPAIQAMRESVVEELVPRRGDGVSDNDQFFDRGADLNTAPAVWVSPSKEKQREEKEKDREQNRRRRRILLRFLGFDSRPIFFKNNSKFTHSIMSVKGWVFQWTMRRRRRQQHCRCFHLQHLSPSTLRRRRRVSMWVLLRSWRHRDQTMTMTMNSVFYVSYQRRHRCVQPKKTSHSFACGKKTFEATDFLFLTLVSRWQLTKFLDIGSCGPQVLKSMRHMENQKREVDI